MNLSKFYIGGGIYIITCLINKQIYIGQSAHLVRRLTEHAQASVGRAGATPLALIQDIVLYGLENFEVKILERYDGTKMERMELETKWMRCYIEKGFSFYNTVVVGQRNTK